MADDPSIDAGDVVAWGSDDEPRRSTLSALATRLGTRERNLTVGLAGGGALLAGLSLLAPWQVASMPADRTANVPATIDVPVAGLDGWGTAYLVGLLGLAAVAALALFGSHALRGPARLAGLGWAAGVLGLLVATAANLGQPSATLRYLYLLTNPDPRIEYGAGPFLALAGIGLVAAALYLQPQPEEAALAATRDAPAQPEEVAEPVAVAPEPTPGGPIDLMVTEVTPFVHLPAPRDRG